LIHLVDYWPHLAAPKHQAALKGLEHWDWFGAQGGIQPCDPNAKGPLCPVGWLTAAELLLTFMTKYLRKQWYRPAHLIGPSGNRTPLLPYYEQGMRCGLQVRWDDPLVRSPGAKVGERTFGSSVNAW